jgi:hypothetical protein
MIQRLALLLVLLAPAATAQSGPWTDLGFALAGAKGLPELECTGPLTGGSGLGVNLYNAEVDKAAYLVLGLTAIYAPYKGGVLVPNFDMLFANWTDHHGECLILTHWPHGVPSGISFYLQYWIDDDAAIAKRAGSNAMKGVTP